MKRTFNLGKINLYGTGKRYPVTVEVRLENKGGQPTYRRIDGHMQQTGEFAPEYVEFTACAYVGARMGGQCLDEINKHRMDFALPEREVWDDIYHFWKLYHLNGMHAGTPEQEKAIREWESTKNNRRDYLAVCEMLKEKGLYEVLFTGKTVGRMYNNEPYKYGCGWVVEQIPGADLIRIEHLLSVV